MTFNITIGPSQLDSDSSGVEVSPPSVGSYSYRGPYDEWAEVSDPEELKPSDSARRPWTSAREKPKPESPGYVYAAEEFGPSYNNRDNNCLICAGDKDQDKDITVHLNIEAGLDISHDLGNLARLSRLGHFYQAVQLFEDRLAPHIDFFPVVAEFADLLLEQENFGQLSKFISSRLTDPHVKYSDEEVLLLKVIKSLAEIYTRGAVIPALEMSTEALKHLTSNHRSQSSKHIAGSQIQLVEACVRIIAYAAAHSNFLESERFKSLLHWSLTDDGLIRWTNDDEDYYRMPPPPPPPPPRSSRSAYARYRSDYRAFHSKKETSRHRSAGRGNALQGKCPQIGPWYRLLVQEGFLWESHRILRAILPLFASRQGHYVDDGSFEEFAQLDDISKAGEVFLQPKGVVTDDEQALLTEFANACLLARFLNDGSAPEAVRTTHSQFFNKSHSLASAILSAHPHLIKSRTYLDWALLESTRELSTICQLADNQQRSVAERWPHDIPSGVQSLHPRDPIVETAGLTQTLSNPLRYRNLDIISASARELGDYRLEEAVLQKIYQLSRDFEQRLQAVQARARLHYGTLQNASGYLSCLIDEFRLLDSGDSTSREGMRKDLQRRLAEFNASFPFRFDYTETFRQNSAIVFFDNPLLKRMERKVSYLLLKSLGRDVEAELARVQLADVECHLPRLDSTPLQPPAAAVHDERGNHSSPAQIPVTATEKKNDPPVGWPSARAILPESYRSGDATDEVAQIWEKRLVNMRKELAEEKRKEREAKETARLACEKLKLAEERAGAAEASSHAMPGAAQQLITLKDPAGREFLFPFEQCRSFTAFEVLMQRVLVHDSILSQHISNGDYELIGPGGNPVSRVDWDSVIQPGSTITMRSKPDSGQEPSQTPEKEDDDWGLGS